MRPKTTVAIPVKTKKAQKELIKNVRSPLRRTILELVQTHQKLAMDELNALLNCVGLMFDPTEVRIAVANLIGAHKLVRR